MLLYIIWLYEKNVSIVSKYYILSMFKTCLAKSFTF